jgi:hypothetical protein
MGGASDAVARLRIDGRNTPSAYLFQVKTPAESNGPRGLYKLLDHGAERESLSATEQRRCSLVPR